MNTEDQNKIRLLRDEILAKTRELISLRSMPEPFEAGVTSVPYAARVYDAAEVEAGVDSLLDFWLTLGPKGEKFERKLGEFLGVRKSLLVNSGSSANLVAMSSLTSVKLGERRIRPGDEVITVASGFPTTVGPIVQVGAVPVFIDVNPITMGPRLDQMEDAYVPGKTKAVIFAHALGNPFEVDQVKSFCEERNLWLIEDNCDSLGSLYGGKLTGSFGDLSTQSFYPPHHITMGEGGAVNIVDKAILKGICESFRDWGRDCWCPSGKDNTCQKRFDWQLGSLPHGYDHKYIYSHIGYNLKPLDVQAAIGTQQLNKLPDFVQMRIKNWNKLRAGLAGLEDDIDFMLPANARCWTSAGFDWVPGRPKSAPSWFGFMMLIKPSGRLSRTSLAKSLESAKIGNRMFFGGNLLRQPAFVQLDLDTNGQGYRVVGDLEGSDRILNEGIFVGTYPGITEEMCDYMIHIIRNAMEYRCEL